MVGVVVTDITNTHFTAMVRATEDAAYRRGYPVLLCNTDENAAKQATYLDMLADQRVLGVILTPADPTAPGIRHLLDLGIPVVATDRPVADPRADAVVVDNADAGRIATLHVIEQGHRRIGFISGPLHVSAGFDRLAGHLEVMAAAGLEVRHAPGDFTIDGGRRAAKQLMQAPGGITALIASNGTMAFGALQAIQELGLRMPDDIAYVALDEPFWMSLMPITTLAQPVKQMAEASVDLILDRITGEAREPRRMTFAFELHPRLSSLGSTAFVHPDRIDHPNADADPSG
jgi:DNA-binding LacI/PurR family transcriptional regulator